MTRRQAANPGSGTGSDPGAGGRAPALVRRQLQFGWWSLLLFLTFGLGLETLHGFKVDWYLSVANDTRRLLWTLGHAHGTLLSLINIVFALTVAQVQMRADGAGGSPPALRLAGRCLMGATVMLPAGFVLGGAVVYAGDPNLTVLLVPLGAVLLIVGVLLAARHAAEPRRGPGRP